MHIFTDSGVSWEDRDGVLPFNSLLVCAASLLVCVCTGTLRFIGHYAILFALHFIVLNRYCVVYKLKAGGNSVEPWVSVIFSHNIRSLHVSVSHFNSHNISSFFIVIVWLLSVISDG